MKSKFDVKVLSVQEIHELPDGWSGDDYKSIMELADFDDWDKIEESELKDYTIMTLQELDPEEAAAIVLGYKFQGLLTKGQIHNLVFEMMEENLWEEYQNISYHKELFNCAVMMKWAFPKKFPQTDAVKCVLEVNAYNQIGTNMLHNADKSLIARLIANGMNDHSVINRLFDDQVLNGPFPEAEHIVWQFDSEIQPEKTKFTIFSSWYWLRQMDDISNYTAETFSDQTNLR
ncbi:hypothetical protein [Reichenbachiella sp. MALMAid0571]|uniref:hypothetical protein n=1 Tax=Reichenbachiella sp. MALMAid0571 TaxID=3143939 RepID=UPI0032DF3C08